MIRQPPPNDLMGLSIGSDTQSLNLSSKPNSKTKATTEMRKTRHDPSIELSLKMKNNFETGHTKRQDITS